VHNLKLNTNKTKILKFDRHADVLSVEYKDDKIKTSDETTFLGWKLDSGLSWNCHIDYLASGLSAFCHALRVIANSVGVGAAVAA
jgi:hypothetical protein